MQIKFRTSAALNLQAGLKVPQSEPYCTPGMVFFNVSEYELLSYFIIPALCKAASFLLMVGFLLSSGVFLRFRPFFGSCIALEFSTSKCDKHFSFFRLAFFFLAARLSRTGVSIVGAIKSKHTVKQRKYLLQLEGLLQIAAIIWPFSNAPDICFTWN